MLIGCFFFLSHNAGVVEDDTSVSGLVGEAKDRVQTKLDGRTGDTDGYLLSSL